MSVLAPKVKGVAVRSVRFVDQIIFKFDDNSRIFWGHTGSTTVFGNTRGSLSYWKLQETSYRKQLRSTWSSSLQNWTCRSCLSYIFPYCWRHYPTNVFVRWQFIPAGPWILPTQWLHVWWKQTSGDEDGLVSARSGKGLKAAILKMLDFPGAQFVGKIAIGQIVSRALDAGFTGEALPLGLIKQLKTNGFCAGLKGFAVESLQQNSQVFGSIAGVLLAHIVAPIYAAEGKGEEAASLAGGAMIGLGAAIAVPGGAAIAVGLLAPFVIKKIFDIVPKPEEIRAKYRRDMYKMYQTYSEPLSSALAEVGLNKVKFSRSPL